MFNKKQKSLKQESIIDLNNKNHMYLCDHNLILNRELMQPFSKFFDKEALSFNEHLIDKDYIKKKTDTLEHVIFEMSQGCNLRCKYCTYSNMYPFHREHQNIVMDYEIAKKGVDFIYKTICNNRGRKVTFGFYGGEPLKNYRTIQKTIDYIKKVFKNWEISFVVNTNGTLLTREIINYFIKEKVKLSISIDGPKKLHDAKRVFPDETGTFDLLMKNLNIINKLDEDYYRNFITFMLTISKDHSLKEITDFFKTCDLIKNNTISFNTVNELDTDYYQKFPYNRDDFSKDVKLFSGETFDKKSNNKELTPIEEYYFNKYMEISTFLRKRSFSILGNACVFNDRLFIDVKGNFHVCEKINHNFSFGNVDDGFDFDKMEKIVNDYLQLIIDLCLSCEVRFLCRKCYIYFAKGEEMKIDDSFCKSQKESIKKNLNHYVKLMEKYEELRNL